MAKTRSLNWLKHGINVKNLCLLTVLSFFNTVVNAYLLDYNDDAKSDDENCEICEEFKVTNQESVSFEYDEKYIFDKAKYHFESIENDDLDEVQAFVHTGLYLTWLIKNNLTSDFFNAESEHLIQSSNDQTIPPYEIYMEFWDGVLLGEMLNETGYLFSRKYFDFDTGDFPMDYDRTFLDSDSSFFSVEPTWTNYEKIEQVFDKRFEEWKKTSANSSH